MLGLEVNVDGGLVQTWPNWLAIAFDRLQEANDARQRLAVTAAGRVGEAGQGVDRKIPGWHAGDLIFRLRC